MGVEWTEWTSSLAVAEAMTDWAADRRPGKWTGQDDPRPVVMVLLACAIEATSHDRGIQATNPRQLEPLPLEPIGDYLTSDRARALLQPDHGLSPAGGQLGADQFDELVRMSAQPDNGDWPRVVDLAAEVITQHVAEHPIPGNATIAGRRTALARNARRQLFEQLDDFFGEDY